MNDVYSFNNSNNNIKEMIAYFKVKNNKSKKKLKKNKTFTTILKSIDTFVSIATRSISIMLSFTGIGLLDIPISFATACELSIGIKVIKEINITKYKNNRKHYEQDQQTIKCSEKLYRNSLQDNVIDKSDNESLCNNFTKYLEETKMNFF